MKKEGKTKNNYMSIQKYWSSRREAGTVKNFQTLFFELERNWTGLLIEPVTEMFKEIVKRQRNVYTLNACIADSKPYIAKIRVFIRNRRTNV